MPISGAELIVILLVLTIIIGPSGMPQAAKSIATWIRAGRLQLAKLKAELNENGDFDGIDFAALDPRQYDPRHLVKEAVAAELDEWKELLSPFGGDKTPANPGKSGADGGEDSIIGVVETASTNTGESSGQAASLEGSGGLGKTSLASRGRSRKQDFPRYGGFYRLQPVVRPAAGPSGRTTGLRLKKQTNQRGTRR